MRPLLLIGFIALYIPVSLPAQEVPARLSLEEALRLAQRFNPQHRQVTAERDLAAAQRRQGIGGLLPSLSASFGTGGSDSRTRSAEDHFGEIQEREEYLRSRGSSTSQGLSASLTLFDGGANLNRIRESTLNAEAVEARITAHYMQLRADVATRFFVALQAEQAVAVEEQLLASAREQFEMTERRFEIGSARREDLLGAEAQVVNQEQQLEQARNNAEKMRLQLLRELGVDQEIGDFELVDERIEIFDPSSLDEEELIAEALRVSPRILEREAALRSRKHGVSTARGARLPRITVSGGMSRSTTGREFDALFDLSPINRSFNFNISASLPLFTGFQNAYNIASAEVQLTNATEQLRAERIALETEIKTALVDLRNAYHSHQRAERSLRLSQERLELTEERYRLGGTVSFLDLQNAIDGAARAERQAIDARFAFVNALVTLEAKVGREVRP